MKRSGSTVQFVSTPTNCIGSGAGTRPRTSLPTPRPAAARSAVYHGAAESGAPSSAIDIGMSIYLLGIQPPECQHASTMLSGRFYEHRAATYIAALQFLIIIAGTLMVVAATRNWGDWGPHYSITPWIRFIRSAGLLALVLPIAWLAATILRSEHSRFRLEPTLWKLAGIAMFLFLILLYTAPLFLVFMPDIGPLKPLDQ